MSNHNEEAPIKPTEKRNRRGGTRVRELDFLPEGMDIIYGKELKSFFADFEKNYGTEPKDLLEEIQAIWRKDGLVHPKELMTQLLSHRLEAAGIPDNVENTATYALLREVIEADYMPEPLTHSYDSKQAVPLMTGFAHLYAQTVAQESVTIIEGDFGNMGGTNVHFAALNGHPDDSTKGWDGTDSAARIAANIAFAYLQDFVGEDGKVYAARNGGDELRLIVTGVSAEKVNAFLRDVVHPAIDEFTAAAGLHDHPHMKEKEGINPKYREGFSLSFGAADLKQTGLSENAIVLQAEEMINVNKLRSGYIRKGEVTEELLEEAERDANYIELQEALRASGYEYEEDLTALAAAKKEWLKDDAAYQATQFAGLKDTPSQGMAAFEAVKEQYAAYHPEEPLQNHLFAGHKEDKDRLPFHTEYAGLEEIIWKRLQENGIILTDDQKQIFSHAAEGYPAIDPVTLTLTDRDLARHASFYAQDAAVFGDLPSRALHVEFTNLAGYNEISHNHANLILREEAALLEESLKEAGLNEKAVYHTGGGKFVVLIPSVDIHHENQAITQEKIDSVTQEIATKIAIFNARPIADFFVEKGMDNPEKLIEKGVADKNIGDIVNPKRAHETGIEMLCVQRDLNMQQRGGQQIYALRQEAEQQMQAKRVLDMPIEEPERPATWVARMGGEREKLSHSFAEMVAAKNMEPRARPEGFNRFQ